jgi:hypothetical protein
LELQYSEPGTAGGEPSLELALQGYSRNPTLHLPRLDAAKRVENLDASWPAMRRIRIENGRMDVEDES